MNKEEKPKKKERNLKSLRLQKKQKPNDYKQTKKKNCLKRKH